MGFIVEKTACLVSVKRIGIVFWRIPNTLNSM